MQKRVKRTLIGLLVSTIIITLVLVLLGLAKVELDQSALNYNTITSDYSDTTLYGPGLYWIGISNRFLRFNKNQQTLRFSNLSAFSSDFYRITANMEVTLLFNFSTGDKFKAASSFLVLFGENPMEIISPLIKDSILVALSSQKSSFYQYTSQPNAALQSSLATSITASLAQWVTTTVNVIVESVICEGSTSNTEIIDRQIDSLIHDLQRTSVEQVELSSYFSGVYSNKQQQVSSVSTALSMKALQLQRIYQMYGTNTTGMNISHIIYDNRPLKYNLNLVNILEDLAKIANRTFPY